MTRVLQTLKPAPNALGGDLILGTGRHPVDGLGEWRGIARGVSSTLGYDLSDATLSVRMLRTMAGGSTLTLDLTDPDDFLVETPLIGGDWTVRLGEQVFQTVQKRRTDWSSWQVTLESELVVALKDDKAVRHAERGKVTRAQFARQIAMPAIRRVNGKFFSPELNVVQRESQDERSRGRAEGLHPKQSLKVKGRTATRAQLRIAEQGLDEAVELRAPRRAMDALIAAGIVESGLANLDGGDADSAGWLQARVGIHGLAVAKDPRASARKFLQDPGFAGGGGAISLANKHPDWEPWQIAAAVQAPRADLRRRYKTMDGIDVQQEARNIVQAYGGSASEEDVNVYTFKQGEAGKPARAWDALEDLASEVAWRRWEVGGVLFFMAEDDLIRSRPRDVIRMRRDQDGLRGTPIIDLDSGKPADEIEVDWVCDLWDAPPGTVIVVEKSGPMDGRWLVESIDRADVLQQSDPVATVTLKRPDAARAEPAGESKASSRYAAERDPRVRRMLLKADAITKKKYSYSWGGGHNGSFSGPYDCSGLVSAVLHAGGLLDAPLTTTGLKTWGKAGQGDVLTVWVKETSNSRQSHTYMTLKVDGDLRVLESGSGARKTGWREDAPHPRSGFVPRHWEGL